MPTIDTIPSPIVSESLLTKSPAIFKRTQKILFYLTILFCFLSVLFPLFFRWLDSISRSSASPFQRPLSWYDLFLTSNSPILIILNFCFSLTVLTCACGIILGIILYVISIIHPDENKRVYAKRFLREGLITLFVVIGSFLAVIIFLSIFLFSPSMDIQLPAHY